MTDLIASLSSKSILNSLGIPVSIVDKEGIIHYANQSFADNFVLTPDEIIGKTDFDILPKELAEKYRAVDREVIDSGEQLELDEPFILDGEVRFVQTIKAPVLDDDDGIVGVLSIFRDITERKKIEKTLITSEEHTAWALQERMMELEVLYGMTKLSSGPDIGIDEFLSTSVSLISAAWQYPEITCARISFGNQAHTTPNFRETEWGQSATFQVNQEAGSIEVFYLEERPEFDEGPFLKEERNLIDRLAVVVTNFLRRKHTANELLRLNEEVESRAEQSTSKVEHSKALFHDFFTNAIIGFHIFGPDGTIIEVNRTELDLIGYTYEEIVGKKKWVDLIVPEDTEKYEEHWKKINETGEVRNLEYTLVHKDGHHVHVLLSASARFDKKGRLMNTIGSILDITERKKAEQAMTRILIETLVSDTEEDVARACLDVAQEITGSKYGLVAELNSRGALDTLALTNPGWDACEIKDAVASLLLKGMIPRGLLFSAFTTGESIIANSPETHPDMVGLPKGHPPITSFMGVPLKRADETIGMIGLVGKEEGYDGHDIEFIEAISIAFEEAINRKRAEQKIAETRDRAEFFVDLMGHDLSNIHQAVSATMELLLYDENVSPGVVEIVNETIRQVGRATRLITDVKKFRSIESNPSELVTKDLSEALSKAARSVQEDMSEKQLVIHTDLDSRNFNVYADEMLKDVFYSVLHNAMKYDPQDVVEVDVVVERKDDSDYLKVSIIDHGTGITDIMKENLFQRIAKKKEGYWGTGIGLTLSKRIIEHYGYQIWVEDRVPGDHTKGSSISMNLPIAEI